MYTQNHLIKDFNMHSHIAKWGNSLGIRVPKAIVEQLELTDGSIVDLTIENDQIIISKPKYSLNGLLEKIDKNNLHEEIDFGESRGREW